jgi:dynein heavy chain 1
MGSLVMRRVFLSWELLCVLIGDYSRFVWLLSFDSDTGLSKALETVSNYNTLIKDFPLNGLLAATDIEAIRIAIIDIFSHLKKVRNTNYSAQRSQALVQAISRDLNEQLLKVLTAQQLMHVRLAYL